jgi:hypothetical protein
MRAALAVSLSTKPSKLGQDRHDQPERKHVEKDGDEDEGRRRAADWRRLNALLHGGLLGQDGRLRLWANGLAFSRSAIRTGAPGRLNTSRRELTR